MFFARPSQLRRVVAATTAPALVATLLAMGSGCVSLTTLGTAPADADLVNNGTAESQSDLYHTYRVVYDRQTFRRPGADPAVVAEEEHLSAVADVSTLAWSDDAYNYLSASDEAAEVMEHPAVAFDQFAHSGTGETVLLGTGLGAGVIAGGVAWFVQTTLRDGISSDETSTLIYYAAGGLAAGGALGAIMSAAYTYIVPSLSTPFATPLYRRAALAYNEELAVRIEAMAPAGDPPENPITEDSADADAEQAAPEAVDAEEADDETAETSTPAPTSPAPPPPPPPPPTSPATPK